MSASEAPTKCGTNAGYESHKYYKTAPCRPCRQAHAEHQRNYRATTATDWRMRQRARNKALTALSVLYPDEYRRLYVQEVLAQKAVAR